jgi:hypothetical protein
VVPVVTSNATGVLQALREGDKCVGAVIFQNDWEITALEAKVNPGKRYMMICPAGFLPYCEYMLQIRL